MKWMWLVLALATARVQAADASLTILTDHAKVELTQSQLLHRSDVRTVTVTGSVYHQRFTQFKAIPIDDLFAQAPVAERAVIQCNGSDGFSAIFEKARLLGAAKGHSHAYLAVEDPQHPWPQLTGQSTTAGPFYLVWTDPEASAIGREEWPFKVTSFQVLADPRAAFPDMYPADGASAAVVNGFKSFEKNCFTCHKMNGNGAGTMGPDLNHPKNPTEYFEPAAFRSFIRDPASVRSWPAMGMRGFTVAAIPDAELDDLIAYLKSMSAHKRPS